MNTPSAGQQKHAILLTGPPGIGKTTVIRRVAAGLAARRIGGFTTEEMRVGGERVGFKLETFDGRSLVFAHVDRRSVHRVGKYGVDVGVLEGIADSALDPAGEAQVYLIDEIGKMECLSFRFVEAVTALLDSERLVVAAVAARGGGFIERAKSRMDVEVWPVTRGNRDSLPSAVLAWLDAQSRFGQPAKRPR